MSGPRDQEKAKLVGINHLDLEVGDVGEALEWYGKLFDFKLRGRTETMAWIDMGDQFIALSEPRTQTRDKTRHFGLVVDRADLVRAKLAQHHIRLESGDRPGAFTDFFDPWGNRIQLVEYRKIQFSKLPEVLESMGLRHLVVEGKTKEAREQLEKKGVHLSQSLAG